MKQCFWAGAAMLGLAGTAHAQEGPRDDAFDGVYVGISISLQNVIAGALVNGVDVLAQDARPAVDFFVGWRKTFDNGFVLGLETGVGFEDGNMSLSDATGRIDWSNNVHWRYGGMAGYRFEDGPLVFAYLNETKRDFDVRLQNASGVGSQKDGQGLLRFGLGAEMAVADGVNLRAMIGSSRADFGDLPLSREPGYPIEVEAGALYQF